MDDWVSLALVILPVLAVLLACFVLLGWVSSPSSSSFERAVPVGGAINRPWDGDYDAPREGFETSRVPVSSAAARWAAIEPGHAPFPLIDLALRRLALDRGDGVTYGVGADGAPKDPTVIGAWVEVRDDDEVPPELISSADRKARWYRWTLNDVCFIRQKLLTRTSGPPEAWCENGLDVRIRAEWSSGTPPIQWAIEEKTTP